MKTFISKDTLNKARETGYSSINKDDILYKIQKMEDETFSVIARTSEKIVGVIGGTPGLDHDAIFVNEDFRGKGIGEVMFAIKTALDGKRQHEWSQKYSRIRFLIQHGYYPIAIADGAKSPKIPLKKEDIKKLGMEIQEAKNASFANDDADNLYYFELAPWKAFFLARRIRN